MRCRMVLVTVSVVGLVAAGCGDDASNATTTTIGESTTTADSTSSTDAPTSTSTEASTTTTAAPAVTLGWVIDGITQDLADRSAYAPPGLIVCAEPDETVVGRGTVLYCNTEAPSGFEEGFWLIVVIDDSGTSAYTAATDMVDLHAVQGTGLFCRDLLALPYLSGTTPEVTYLASLAYWFQDGEPDRMDADRNGVPCETLFESDVVAAVWAGGSVQ